MTDEPSPNEEARRQGITDEGLGVEKVDYDYHLPDEQTVADVQKERTVSADDLPQQNAEPVPPGTPDKIAKCFRAIPAERVKKYRVMYDGFEKKDMPFCEFCVEMAYMSSPMMMNRDLQFLMERRQMGYARQAGIETAISRGHRN